MLRQVEKILDEQIRPALAAHGGNVELIDVDNDKIYVRLTGGCQGCSSSQATLSDGISRLLMKHFPEITDVIDMTDHDSGDNPYFT